MTKLNLKALMMLGVIMAAPAKADFNSDLSSVQKQWAVVNYELVDDAQLNAFEKLASETAEFTKANDQQAASHIWYGIVLSSYAGAKGGLGALGLAKDAKAQFEKALSLDPKALDGVTSVGITAGASAPEEIVQEVIDYLASYDFKKVRDLSQNKENLTFKLPKELAAL